MPTPNAQALEKRSPSTVFMPPPPPPKRIKRPTQVLQEEEYEEGLSHIIKRDFFPGLAETDVQKEYLAALESGDLEWISEVSFRLRAMMQPGQMGRKARAEHDSKMTPVSGLHGTAADTPRAGWTAETPINERELSAHGESLSLAHTSSINENLSLEEFQRAYTSEDNESFYRLVDKQNSKRREKYSWIHTGNKIPTPRQLQWRQRQEQERDLVQASKRDGLTSTSITDDGKHRETLRVEYHDDRPAAPQTWKTQTSNPFMFVPSSIEDEFGTAQQRTDMDSRMGLKEIVYENTRMPRPLSRAQGSVPESPSLSAVRDAIAGRPRLADSELGDPSMDGIGSETPRVNGYAFVDSEEPEVESSLESKGEGAYNLDLGPGDATPNPFSIREARGREALHHRIVDELNRKKSEKWPSSLRTPVGRPQRTSQLAREGMSPAARRLLDSVSGSTPKVGNSLGNAWGSSTKSRPIVTGITPVRRNK